MRVCDIGKIVTGIIDVLFPPRCILCGLLLDHEQAVSFCQTCFSQISPIRSPLCTRCGIPFNDSAGEDHLCGECISSAPFFSLARAFGRYDGSLMEAIHGFKYRGTMAMGEILGKLMAEGQYGALRIEEYDVVFPVPLHPRRLKERGFNQSLILAKGIARKYSRPLEFTTVKRSIHTIPQIALKRKERETNVKGAFLVTDAARVEGKRILLIDDVYTTGSTVKECSRVLMHHGAREVAILTLARNVQ